MTWTMGQRAPTADWQTMQNGEEQPIHQMGVLPSEETLPAEVRWQGSHEFQQGEMQSRAPGEE